MPTRLPLSNLSEDDRARRSPAEDTRKLLLDAGFEPVVGAPTERRTVRTTGPCPRADRAHSGAMSARRQGDFRRLVGAPTSLRPARRVPCAPRALEPRCRRADNGSSPQSSVCRSEEHDRWREVSGTARGAPRAAGERRGATSRHRSRASGVGGGSTTVGAPTGSRTGPGTRRSRPLRAAEVRKPETTERSGLEG